jgi:MYXO-CTERM domain-containing protein
MRLVISALAALMVVAVLWLAPRGARACSCMPQLPPPEQALADADAVFEARPFSMSTDNQRAHYSFEVDRVWKGEVGPRVEISSALHSATCGRSFQIGTQYVVYARRSPSGELTDNMCSRTRPVSSAAEDLQVLGAGQDPRDASAPPVEPDPDPEPTEPPRIEPAPVEPPPAGPGRRGCAVEKPHASSGPAVLALLGLAVAIGRRRAVRSPARR